MPKTTGEAENPTLHRSLKAPMNSIVAAASTAHDLDTAHRKAIKAQPFRSTPSYGRSDVDLPASRIAEELMPDNLILKAFASMLSSIVRRFR